MFNPKPKTAEQYVRLVDQALDEVEELRACYEFDMEDMGSHKAYLEPLESGLRTLRTAMADGSYQFENRDLPFMEIATKHKRHLPFADLLAVINETHRHGLAVDDE